MFLRLISLKNVIIFHHLEYMYSKEKNAKNNFLISFRCFHPTGVVLPFATQKCMKTVVACFKLHNKCIKNRLLMPDRGGLWYPAPGWEEIKNLQANGAGAVQQIQKRLVQCFYHRKFNKLASEDNKIDKGFKHKCNHFIITWLLR